MSFGIRRRLFLWLALVIVPIAAAVLVAVELVEHRLSERIEIDLASVHSLEADRIEGALETYRQEVTSLVAGGGLGDTITALAPDAVDDLDGSATVTPRARARFDAAAEELLSRDQLAGGQLQAVRFVARSGLLLGDSGGFSWEPIDPAVVPRALASGRPVFGDAFRAGDGRRIGVVAPIFNTSAVIVGAVLLEARVGPVIDPLLNHQEFGDTREAYLGQVNGDGAIEFITPLRFEEDSVLGGTVPEGAGRPINLALAPAEGVVVSAPDYRDVDSVLAVGAIEATGWGLVIKLDRSEAYGLVGEVRRVLTLSGLAAVVMSLFAWLLLVRPLGIRLRRSAAAAERVAAGDYLTSIGDAGRDEVGDLARTIDRLAGDLRSDIERRTVVEDRLRHRASHDDLTGLHNRRHATDVVREILEARREEPLSLLFLDVDKFKLINDTHGHAAGDEVLVAVGRRLSGAVDTASTVARWGGDEFVVVLPGCDAPGAASVVDRLRDVFGEPVSTTVGTIDVRCSLGTATARPGSTVDSLVQEADAAMFTDKELGGPSDPVDGRSHPARGDSANAPGSSRGAARR